MEAIGLPTYAASDSLLLTSDYPLTPYGTGPDKARRKTGSPLSVGLSPSGEVSSVFDNRHFIEAALLLCCGPSQSRAACGAAIIQYMSLQSVANGDFIILLLCTMQGTGLRQRGYRTGPSAVRY